MKIHVKLFAGARELVGEGLIVHELPDGATMGHLVADLFNLYPGLREMRLRFAVNATYAGESTRLQNGDEVACIPPVGGG